MRYVLNAIPYAHRNLKAVGPVNPLIVGRASAMFETAENHGGLGGIGMPQAYSSDLQPLILPSGKKADKKSKK